MNEISLDTKRYLDQIGSRVRAYHNAMNRAKDFVLSQEIMNHEIVLNCIVISLLWLAAVRNEELSEEELFMFLNLETDLASTKIIQIDDDMKDWSLEEVLSYVVDKF